MEAKRLNKDITQKLRLEVFETIQETKLHNNIFRFVVKANGYRDHPTRFDSLHREHPRATLDFTVVIALKMQLSEENYKDERIR